MKDKSWIWPVASSVLSFAVSYAVVAWLVHGSFWLHFFLASATAGLSFQAMEIVQLRQALQHSRMLFDISDAQLVRVSKHVDEMQEEIDDFKEKLREFD